MKFKITKEQRIVDDVAEEVRYEILMFSMNHSVVDCDGYRPYNERCDILSNLSNSDLLELRDLLNEKLK